MSVLEVEAVEEAASERIFHLRDVEWRDSGNGKEYTFVGSAAVFNTWSDLLWTPRGTFRERFLFGSFTDVLATEPDVRFLKNHDKNLVLARTKAKTLDIQETDEALRIWARVARTSYATDLKLSMERGDIDQMSLQFEMDFDAGAVDRWYEDKSTGDVCRDVVKVSGLYDVSVVTFPAYVETSASMRDIRRAVGQGRVDRDVVRLPSFGVVSAGTLTPAEVREADGYATRYVEEYSKPTGRLDAMADPVDVVAGLADVEPLVRSRTYARCRQVVGETPWAILPGSLAMILAILDERASGNKPSQEEIQERVGVKRDNEPRSAGGVAVIPLVGPILSRAGAMQTVSGAKSIDDFRAQLNQAVNDPAVTAVVLDIDSPGGTVSLVPETATAIRAATKLKPVVGVANSMAASAAYWLLCACSETAVTPSGEVGSVGVYAAHQDVSEEMKIKGVKTTFVHAGKYKVTGNMFEPLSDEARAQIQADVDSIYKDFTGAVAKYRGTTVTDVVDNFGEGRCILATEALALGMVDSIETLEQVVERLSAGTAKRDGEAGVEGLVGHSGHEGAVGVTGVASPLAEARAAIPPHETPVVDKPWDGPAATSKVKAERGALRGLHAWVDSGGNPNLKGSYKFPHHEVGDDGEPGDANVNGVRNALSRLPGSDVPDGDKPSVERHLQRHLDDFKAKEGDEGGDSPDGGGGDEAAAAHSPLESREALRGALGLVAPVDLVGDSVVAPETEGTFTTLAELRAESRAGAAKEREEFLRLTGRLGR